MGVVWSKVTGASLVRMEPTITRPIIMSKSSLPASVVASCASPTVPPAPGTLKTSTCGTMPVSCRTVCIALEVPSQPPPGEAGAIIRSDCGGSWARVSPTPDSRRKGAKNKRSVIRFIRHLFLFEC